MGEQVDGQTQRQVNEQALIVAKDSFFIRVTQSIRKFFFKGKMKSLLMEEENKVESNKSKIKLIQNNPEFVQEYILNARSAYRKYVINNNKSISSDILSLVKEKIKENESKIKKLIEINEDDISYNDIFQLLEKEEKAVNEFKFKDIKTERYNVPIGVIGVECNSSKEAIENIFKSISTRNSFIILQEKYNKYSIEALILLIVKECIKSFYIDDNIIQMYEDNMVQKAQLDKLIKKDKDVTSKTMSKVIYIYQENDEYEDEIMKEFERLKNEKIYKSYDVKLIKGEFGNIINYLNRNDSYAVCMYTSNAQKAYKLINWVNSPNVFVNTGIQSSNGKVGSDKQYYNSKFVLHKDVF